MHAPQHVCRALADSDPQLRLVWLGRAPTKDHIKEGPEDELGCFGVLRILPKREAMAAYNTIHSGGALWPQEFPHTGSAFSANGDSRPDWDLLTSQALLIRTVDADWGMSHEDVFGTKLVAIMRAQRTNASTRKRAKQDLLAQASRDRASALAPVKEALAEGIKAERSRTDSDIRIVEARKHARAQYEEDLENEVPTYSMGGH